jgi:predicted RNase H-like nuclease (RuvC/YqgF family)
MVTEKRTAVRVLEERLEELESENESLREEKAYYADVAKKFRDTLSEMDFEEEDDDGDDEEDDDEDEK